MRVKEGECWPGSTTPRRKAAARARPGPARRARSQLAEIRAQLVQAERDYARQQELADRS